MLSCTSESMSVAVVSLYGREEPRPSVPGRYGLSRGASVTGPSRSLIPHRVTICRANSVACLHVIFRASGQGAIDNFFRATATHGTGDARHQVLPTVVVS